MDERRRDDFPNNFVGVRRDVTGQREPDRASHFQSVDRGALSLLGRPDSSFPVALFSADRQSVGGGISRVVDYSRHVRVALRRLTSAKKLGGFGRCPHRRCRRAKLRAYQYIPARLQLLVLPGWTRLQRPWLVGQRGEVHLQRPTHVPNCGCPPSRSRGR